MPGMYAAGDYDLAGFAVGAVERDRIIDGRAVRAGDVVVGLASSGLHSNAFSLVRRIVEQARLPYDAPAPFMPDRTLAEALLVPTRLYVKSCLAAAAAGGVKALAHITGGGLVENIPRVIPPEVSVELDALAWPLPPVFRWLAETAGLSRSELARVFNCGLGMIAVVEPSRADAISQVFTDAGETVYRVGRVVPRPAKDAGTLLLNTETAWPG
jgi:phosphoribosylformylglycinamidine cyclo-ligase